MADDGIIIRPQKEEGGNSDEEVPGGVAVPKPKTKTKPKKKEGKTSAKDISPPSFAPSSATSADPRESAPFLNPGLQAHSSLVPQTGHYSGMAGLALSFILPCLCINPTNNCLSYFFSSSLRIF